MAVRRAEALRHNTAHCSYYMRVGAQSVGRPVQVCQPHMVLNLISPVNRHCLKPLCGPGWTGGLTRPVIRRRYDLLARSTRGMDHAGGSIHWLSAAWLPLLAIDVIPEPEKAAAEMRR